MSADVLRLQLLLGCRVGEASRMHASEFSKDTKGRLIWTLPMERSKNNKARVTPIVGLAREIVETRLETANDDGRLFVSERGMDLSATLVGQHIRARWDRLPVERFGTHDLRRTAATQMVELGLSLDIVAAIVGHSAGGVQAQTLVKHYVHSDFIDRKAIALASWDARMHTIISDEKSTGAIIPMRRNNS
jgi:integrase